MKLNFKFYPGPGFSEADGPTPSNLIILHGLFGSSKNWVSISKILSNRFNVYSLDLRNHGDSPHDIKHSIPAMSEDVWSFLQEHKLENVSILGHSMGGLVSMHLDLSHPKFLKSLIIQDIAPRSYPFAYDNEINSMLIDLKGCKSRSDVDLLMQKFVPDNFIRQFLQMNLERSPEGEYFWKLNVSGISSSRNLFSDEFSKFSSSDTPSLFVLGGKSEYITNEDRVLISRYFPHANIKTIPEGGHYIHYTHSEEFLSILNDFFESQSDQQ
jgi:esterase